MRSVHIFTWQGLSEYLTRPSTSVTNEAERNRARLTAALALLALLTVLIATVIAAARPDFHLERRLALTIVPIALLNYGLSRSRHYRIAAVLTTIFSLVFMYAAVALSPSPPHSAIAMLIPLVIASLFWPTRLLIGIIAVTIVSVVSLIGFDPKYHDFLLIVPLFLLFPAVALIWAAVLRESYERRVAEQTSALIASENRYRDLFDNSPLPLWEVDLSGALQVIERLKMQGVTDIRRFAQDHPELLFECALHIRILSGNRAGITLLGLQDTASLSANDYCAFVQENLAEMIDVLVSASERRLEYSNENITAVIQGQPRSAHLRWSVLAGHEQTLSRVLLSVEDITVRKQAERHRLELAMERERSSLLHRFLSDVTHDLMTPLTTIKTGLYLLSQTPSANTQQERLQAVSQQTDHLERLIRQMLIMVELDSGDARAFNFCFYDLNPFVNGLVSEYQNLAATRGQTLRFNPAANLPLVSFDADRLRQALANLLDNAIEHTPTQGMITLATRFAGEQVSIEVQDTGTGIAASDLPHIFDRLYRSENHRPTTGGAGLGLSIVQRIVELHGGTIHVTSQPGRGTMVQIRLHIEVAASSIPAQVYL